MGFAALFFVRLQHGVLFPCLQLGLFPCLLPDGSSLQRPGLQHLPDGSSLQRPCLQRLPDGASLPADCLPCRSLLPCPLPTVFCSAPAGSISATAAPLASSSATAHRPATSSRWLSATVPPSSSLWHSRPAAPPWHSRPAASSRWLFAAASLPAVLCADGPLPATASPQRLCQQQTLSAEKSTPVWLAIWHTWARFANSQHRDAAFATPDNICAHSSLLQH